MASNADILGIIAIVLAIVGFFVEGLILGLIAIVLAVIGLKLERKNIYCIIGLILGILCFVLAIAGALQRSFKSPPPGQTRD